MAVRRKKKNALPVARDARVRRIARLMSTMAYRGEATLVELAAKWGVTAGTLKEDAAEASRVVKLIAADGEGLKTNMIMALQEIARTAMSQGKTSPHYLKAGIEAIRTIADLQGLNAPTKQEQTISLTTPDVDDAQLAEMAAEALASVKGP